jgi:ferredoxin/flavodoxin---NADP+ reductase
MNRQVYKPGTLIENDLYKCKLKHIRYLTETTFVMQFDRNDIQFKAGQYISLGQPESKFHKEYTIYSGENEEHLDLLVREILEGNVSQQLKVSNPGQMFEISGPFGYLKINEEDKYSKKFIFIASGTGIAPFHSFVKSYPGIDYTVLHGVRYLHEAYDSCDYDPGRYMLCTTAESSGNFHGRVTSYLNTLKPDPDMLFYLCGNSSMIYDALNILLKKNISQETIFSEMHF